MEKVQPDFSGIDPETGERWSARKVARILGLRALHDENEIRNVCERVVVRHPSQAEAYRKGKKALLGFFVKQVMDETRNGADPNITDRVLKELLDGV